MRLATGNRARWAASLVALILTTGVGAAAAAPAAATKPPKPPKPFTLVSVSPAPPSYVTVVLHNYVSADPKKPWKVKWTGSPTFPITVNITPVTGSCSTNPNELHCAPGTDTITGILNKVFHSATLPASDWTCGVSPSVPTGTFIGVFNVTLTDADGQTTNPLPIWWKCSW